MVKDFFSLKNWFGIVLFSRFLSLGYKNFEN